MWEKCHYSMTWFPSYWPPQFHKPSTQTFSFPHSSAEVLSVLCNVYPCLLCSCCLGVYVPSGSLLVESAPGHQLGSFQGIPHQLPHPALGPSGSPHSFALGAPHTTLAQLQLQVEKLNPQANWQPQPPPPPWTWYQSVRLQRTIPGPLQGGPAPSHSMMPQPGRRFMVPPPNHVSPTSSFESPGFTPQVSVWILCVCVCPFDRQVLLTSTDIGWFCPK